VTAPPAEPVAEEAASRRRMGGARCVDPAGILRRLRGARRADSPAAAAAQGPGAGARASRGSARPGI